MANKMKAVHCTKYGNPEVLKIVEVDKPIPKDYEVLVRVIASAVNSGDVRVRGLVVKGFMKFIMRIVLGFNKPRKPILGTVYSGVIGQIGGKVKKFNIGDKVYGLTGFQFGTYAEYVSINENGIIHIKPENATHEESAAILFGGQTAIYFLDRIKKKSNQKILIIGATGAVGTAAIQIAKIYKADITAVCSTSGEELVKNLGVSHIILYDKEDFTYHNGKYDIVFDAVGQTSKKQCSQLLADGGIYKTVGGLETATETKEQLVLLKSWFEEGIYNAVIDRVYPLNSIVEAHAYVDTGRKKGNVVLKIGEE